MHSLQMDCQCDVGKSSNEMPLRLTNQISTAGLQRMGDKGTLFRNFIDVRWRVTSASSPMSRITPLTLGLLCGVEDNNT